MSARPAQPSAYQLLDDPDLRAELEAVRIAALLRRLGHRQDLTSFNIRRIQRNLVALNRVARRQLREPAAAVDLGRLTNFLAQSYEQLVGINEAADTGLKLAAAVNYELAGFQANAATLARQAVNVRTIAIDELPSIPELASMVLQRRFLRSYQLGGLLESLRPPAEDYELDATGVLEAATRLAAGGVARAAGALLRGTFDDLDVGMEDLGVAHGALLDVGFAVESGIVEGLRALLPAVQAKSIWLRLLPELPESRLWHRYMASLARGLAGDDVLDLRSISELWPSQQLAVDSGLLSGGSRIVRMPTSAGKTRVAEMYILHALAMRPGAKALYIAPFNALTTEVTASFNNLFMDLGLSISSLTGTYDDSPLESDVSDDDLLIVTPEKMDQLLRSNSGFLDDVDVVVLDEGHIVGEANRGPKYELAVSRLRRRRPHARFLALSAVVPDETLTDFSAWLAATDLPISTAWRPTKIRVATLDWDGAVGNLVYLPGPGASGLTVPEVVKAEKLDYRHPETGRMRRPTYPEPTHRAQVAAAMAWQVVDQGPVLIYCATPPYAQSVASALSTRLAIAFHREEATPAQLGIAAAHSVAVAEEWLGPEHAVTNLLRSGVGLHYSALPEAVRVSVEDDFRARRLAVLAATPTLAQGVNLPVRTLIVHSTRRYEDEVGSIRLPARDFWNVAGRVGRAGAETEGTLVFLNFNATDEADLQYYVRARERGVEPVESALSRLLAGLVQQRISRDDIARQLDPEMLALLVEEGETTLTEDGLRSVVGDTLFQIQADRMGRPATQMWRLLAATGARIAARVPDLRQREVFATTGLSAPSCQALQQHALANGDALNALVGSRDDNAALRILLRGLTACREMTPRSLDVGHADVLEGWIQAVSVSDLAEDYDVDALQLTSFIEDFFGYRLPWGIAAYLRIAEAALEWDHVPEHLSSLPLLVRYGVPSTPAAWLMALGTPSRSVALRLADRFEQSGRPQTVRGLRRWISNLNLEDVTSEFAASPGRLEAANRMIMRANGNSLLRAYYGGSDLFPLDVALRIRLRSGAADLEAALMSGQRRVSVRRDYDSPYRNAVRLHIERLRPIRLRRQYADVLALELDSGALVNVAVERVERFEDVITLTLSVHKAESFKSP